MNQQKPFNPSQQPASGSSYSASQLLGLDFNLIIKDKAINLRLLTRSPSLSWAQLEDYLVSGLDFNRIVSARPLSSESLLAMISSQS